ncbi:MAG: hypothetical protein P4L87_14000 [Formivibrio sp.]|nr:hypothetical protein [Formivibrio sp.]
MYIAKLSRSKNEFPDEFQASFRQSWSWLDWRGIDLHFLAPLIFWHQALLNLSVCLLLPFLIFTIGMKWFDMSKYSLTYIAE